MDRSRHRRVQQHSYPRTARINALLLEVLAEEIERLADADERLRMLTLTAVICEPDLRHARVLLASLPDGALDALEEHRKMLQLKVAVQVRMRRTPMLLFARDSALEAADRVEDALRRARLRSSPDSGDERSGDGEAP